jgi:hypothetical protein
VLYIGDMATFGMKTAAIFVFLLFSSVSVSAQSKWYVAPAAGFASVDRKAQLTTNITIGHTIGESNRYRIDIWGSYIPKSDIGSVFSTAALFSLADIPLFSTNFVCAASAGAGISKIHNKKSIDFIVPIKCFYGYSFTDNLTLGVEISSFLNLSEVKDGGIDKIGGIPFLGLYLGIKL